MKNALRLMLHSDTHCRKSSSINIFNVTKSILAQQHKIFLGTVTTSKKTKSLKLSGQKNNINIFRQKLSFCISVLEINVDGGLESLSRYPHMST